ncbi:hypothetical protein EAH75_04545 [Rhodanobacter glycinis]|uniref:hypothetical protein n=1 Tax=Rhodanobacter glycinis TaxID=582702 RepID=UPI00112B4718|nr:hypothetical protein [Rhodanobacter glycinis]TPG50712.1 hypothetical protein EAH75_04545 [Rhodanobacter glycinis]
MYRGFNLSLDRELTQFEAYRATGEQFMKKRWPKLEPSLAKLSGSDAIDGDKIMQDWFQQVDANVFISHSHNDLGLAHGFAGYLHKELGLTPFVDSFVWSSADGLLKEFDELYCRSELGSDYRYEYKKRNYSTSHVHMMLAASLSEVIDRCECIIFLNTPESIEVKDAKERAEEKTASPWIYHELNTSRLIRRNPLSRPRFAKKTAQREHITMDSASLEMHVNYKAPVAHLASIGVVDLGAWQVDVRKARETLGDSLVGAMALDILYERVPDPNPRLLGGR